MKNRMSVIRKKGAVALSVRKNLRFCGMPLDLYRYDGRSDKVFTVPSRVCGSIYGGAVARHGCLGTEAPVHKSDTMDFLHFHHFWVQTELS